MKKTLVLAISLAAVAAIPSQGVRAGVPTDTKQEITALGAIGTGAAVGGPVGAVAGLVVGVLLADEIGRAGERDEIAAELAASTRDLDAASSRVASLQQQLGRARADQDRLARSMLESLQVELLFRTGDVALSTTGKSRLNTLARYLKRNPDLEVRVHGYADARGSDAANLALSRARANAVAEQLIAAGVAAPRLKVDGYGEQQAVAAAGDTDAMALERRVVIELSRPRGLAGRLPR